jgi:hypothetical protein
MVRAEQGTGLNNPETLQDQYLEYFRLITGRAVPEKSTLAAMVKLENPEALENYRNDYLKDQILNWSGIVEEIFCETVLEMKKAGIELDQFISYFHQEPLPLETEYDFFKIKLDRFKAFIIEMSETADSPTRQKLLAIVEKEFTACWEAYLSFNPSE